MAEGPAGGTTSKDVNLDIAAQARPGLKLDIDNIRGHRAVAAGLEMRVGLLIDGDAGDFLAAYNAGAIVVLKRGKAGSYLGYGMTGGEIGVVGSVGDAAGAYASGGRVLVYGDAGTHAGWRLAGASLVIKGDAGPGAAAGMSGGEVALLGAAAGTVGEGLTGGVVYARRSVSVDTSCARLEELDGEGAARVRALAAAVKVTEIDPKAYVRIVAASRPAAPPAPPASTPAGGAGPRVRAVRPGASSDEAKAFVDSVVARVREEDD